jgi:hypothetical protein
LSRSQSQMRFFHPTHVVAKCRQSGGKSANFACKFHFTCRRPPAFHSTPSALFHLLT